MACTTHLLCHCKKAAGRNISIYQYTNTYPQQTATTAYTHKHNTLQKDCVGMPTCLLVATTTTTPPLSFLRLTVSGKHNTTHYTLPLDWLAPWPILYPEEPLHLGSTPRQGFISLHMGFLLSLAWPREFVQALPFTVNAFPYSPVVYCHI